MCTHLYDEPSALAALCLLFICVDTDNRYVQYASFTGGVEISKREEWFVACFGVFPFWYDVLYVVLVNGGIG